MSVRAPAYLHLQPNIAQQQWSHRVQGSQPTANRDVGGTSARSPDKALLTLRAPNYDHCTARGLYGPGKCQRRAGASDEWLGNSSNAAGRSTVHLEVRGHPGLRQLAGIFRALILATL
ncbi:hypothetical protein J6590_056978 [Homalodisca vitripennis]|nr:hypothetical protein J6590_056978 [Homalodisca vitripennis]